MADADAQQTSKQKPWLLIALTALVVILVAVIAAGGTYMLMGGGSSGAAPAQAVSGHGSPGHGGALPKPDPVYVEVDPFTVNLNDDSGRVLYVGVSLQVPKEDIAKKLKAHMPQVRNRILLTLTRQKAQTLMTPQGKQALASALREAVSRPFREKAKPLDIVHVLFTNFIVQ